MAKLTLLIDGDIVVHQAAAAAEQDIDWGNGLWTVHAYEADGERIINTTIDRWNELFDSPSIVWVFSDARNFRHELSDGYKANRSGQRKPILHRYLREWVSDQYRTYLKDNLEADDALGILATHKTLIPGKKIIVSLDKDFDTIPATRWKGAVKPNGRPALITVSEEQADRAHMLQTLTGDATDGYPGCPGIGPTRAVEIVDDPHELVLGSRTVKGEERPVWRKGDPCDVWTAVVHQFLKAGKTEEDALLNARFARILRATDYDFDRKEPILWTPTT